MPAELLSSVRGTGEVTSRNLKISGKSQSGLEKESNSQAEIIMSLVSEEYLIIDGSLRFWFPPIG